MHDRVVPDSARITLEVVSPLPGTTFILDPDIPTSARIPLRGARRRAVALEKPNPRMPAEHHGFLAIAQEGEHRLYVTDPETGESGETWVKIRSL